MRRFFIVLSLLAATVSPALTASPISITDIAGRVVELQKPAERLLIDDGRYLIALSLIDDNPVGRLVAWPGDINRIGPAVYEQYADAFPALTQLKQSPSSAGNFSVEQVLAAEPDLAVLSLQSQLSAEQMAQIEAAGIPVVVIDFFNHPLKNLEPSLRLLGEVTGNKHKAEAFIAFRAERMERIKSAVEASPENIPRVFLEPHAARTEECCPSPGRGNIGDYISLTGGHNIGEDVIPGATGTLSLEYVIETDPDVYIATGGPHMEGTNGLLIGPGYDEETVLNTLRKVAGRAGIATLSAAMNGRVHGLSHQLLNSPLDILTVETLARWIRPELFADIDPGETLARINEDFLAVPLSGINWVDLPAEN